MGNFLFCILFFKEFKRCKMNYVEFLFASIIFLSISFSCTTNKVNQVENTNLQKSSIGDDLSLGELDSLTQEALNSEIINNHKKDVISGVVEGRKIIYRDISAVKSAIAISGKIVVSVCINREGIVRYAKIKKEESTISSKDVLEKYLKAATGYRFEPSIAAPEVQCGTILFTIQNLSK